MIKPVELDFQNFKVQDIKTEGNHKVVNPPHKINFNCENFWIIGEIGRGKTTFFDKIYHFFCFNEKATSPIQDLTTNLTIKLKNKESYNIVFNTYSKEKITVLRLDDYNESESSNILKKKGIIDNNLLKLNFISQNMQDDAIYNSNLKVSNFFELNKEYFLDEPFIYCSECKFIVSLIPKRRILCPKCESPLQLKVHSPFIYCKNCKFLVSLTD